MNPAGCMTCPPLDAITTSGPAWLALRVAKAHRRRWHRRRPPLPLPPRPKLEKISVCTSARTWQAAQLAKQKEELLQNLEFARGRQADYA